jgi:hypothetical protein
MKMMSQWMIADTQVAGSGGSGCEFGVSKEAEFGKFIASACYIIHCAYLPLMMSIAQEHLSKCAYSSRWSLSHFGLRPSYIACWHYGCVRVVWTQIDQGLSQIGTLIILFRLCGKISPL